MAQFDKESACGKKKRYEKTLKDLKKVNDMKDVFDGQIDEEQYESKNNLDEAHHISKFWNVVFGAGIALVVVVSLVVMAVAVGVSAPFAVLAAPFLALGRVGVHHSLEKKVNDLKKHEEDGKKQEGITDSTDKGMESNKEALNTI
ncbi:UPF0496 protein At3g28270-like [Capsella rubella]|uniref:UPF0496 protein At3g28270-like n=1 Tax=Capsella rubella TaxID=81985 RepID=UPI000CD4F46B|nr:UPF0496 protein At3g28270-like [Capsella rubella]